MAARCSRQQQLWQYLCVLDFEANCGGARVLPEIIEFPSVLMRFPRNNNPPPTPTTPTTPPAPMEYIDTFESFCKPTGQLTPFCTRLTSITPQHVKFAPPFAHVLAKHEQWLDRHLTTPDTSCIFITCGNSDLAQMLPRQCSMVNLPVPARYRKWIDLQSVFRRHHVQAPGVSLKKMLVHLDMPFEGVHHRGIWDCRNTARIVDHLYTYSGERWGDKV